VVGYILGKSFAGHIIGIQVAEDLGSFVNPKTVSHILRMRHSERTRVGSRVDYHPVTLKFFLVVLPQVVDQSIGTTIIYDDEYAILVIVVVS
jgi:hypothetical protein